MMKVYDLELEFGALRFILSSRPKRLMNVFLNNRITENHFSDLFFRDVFTCIRQSFRKYSNIPDADTLGRMLKTNMTKHPKYKSDKHQLKIWLAGIPRLYRFKTAPEKLQPIIDVLDDLRNGRIVQQCLYETTEQFERGQYNKSIELFNRSVLQSRGGQISINEGDVVGDFQEHLNLIKAKQSGLIVPTKTYFKGVIERDDENKFEMYDMDNHLGGGMYKGDFCLIVGETNIGKSFALMEFCYLISRYGTNVLLITIEMQKNQQQWRIYSRMTKIPFYHFRSGDMTKPQIRKWYDSVKAWKSNCGIFRVVSFNRGATVSAIDAKIQQAMNVHNCEFDFVAIDYINDMSPEAGTKFNTNKDWSAQGEISQGLADLAKGFNNNEGI